MIILVAADTLSAQSSASTSITVTVFGMEIGVGNVETFKRLYQGQPANSATTLYTAPASTQTLIKTITITNPTGSAQTITFWVAGTADTNGILPPISIDAGGFAVYDDDGWKFYSNMGLFKDGVTGFTGSVGFVGSFGATGFTGSQGTTGFTGSQGTTGFVGSTGISHTLTFGAHLVSGDPSFDGTAAASITSDATSSNTVSTIVARDAAGAFSMGALTATGLLGVTVASGYAATFMGGNVGIGTTGPLARLQIASANIASTGVDERNSQLALYTTDALAIDKGAMMTFGGEGGGGITPYVFASISGRKENVTSGNYAGYLAFATVEAGSNSSEWMRINSLGNVGIGTTNPTSRLQVEGTPASPPSIAYLVSTGNAALTINTRSDSATRLSFFETADANEYPVLQGYEVAGSAAKPLILNPYGGNVGIGTTSPYGKLSVLGASADPSLTVGTVATAVFGATVGTELAITNSVSAPYTISLQGRNNTSGPSGTSYPIALNPLGGGVGIGTTNPNYMLDVSGSLGVASTTIIGSDPGGAQLLRVGGSVNMGALTATSGMFGGGNVGIGVAVSTSIALDIEPTSLTTSSQVGIYLRPVYTGAATSLIQAYYTVIQTAAAAFTCSNAYGLHVDMPILGAGSAITTLYGIRVEDQTGGGTNYAIRTGLGMVLLGGAVTLSSTLAVTGLLTNYNAVATAGVGVAANYGSGRVTAKINVASGTIATYTPVADGTFFIVANVLVTATTAASFTVTVTYTDEGNTARTLTLSFTQVAGVPLQTITNVTGTGPYEGVLVAVRAKGGTAITVQTAAGGTYTGVTYNASADILQTAA